MDSIGFKNFRKFADFPSIDLGDVTILVGANNSGKSTIVKALLLCADNLRLMRVNDNHKAEGRPGKFSHILRWNSRPIFRFGASLVHDVKIPSFARAFHSTIKSEDASPYMTFDFGCKPFKFKIVLSGDKDGVNGILSIADVYSITIEDTNRKLRFTANYDEDRMILEVLGDASQKRIKTINSTWNAYKIAKAEIDSAEEELDLDTITIKTSALSSHRNVLNQLIGIKDPYHEPTQEDIDCFIEQQMGSDKVSEMFENVLEINTMEDVAQLTFVNVIMNLYYYASMADVQSISEQNISGVKIEESSAEDELQHQPNRERSNLTLLHPEVYQYKDQIKESADELRNTIQRLDIQYISAHAVNQNTTYTTADRNDYIAQVVDHFYNKEILPGETEYEFVKKWMIEFGIGSDFSIMALEGDAYHVFITDGDGSKMHLADKGMGAIQLMVLLLKLATIIRTNAASNTTVLIEEPEQNLHPKMQSKLAELFASTASEYNCKFLIETHSEYLIRKAQVLVAEAKYVDEDDLKENNPFKIYYLPEDDRVRWEMEFRLDGKFSNEFGEGFFDEASNLLFDIL